MAVRLDSTGKVSFDHIYTEPDPRAYFGTLGDLDYQIPQQAKPYFAELVENYRLASGRDEPTVLDLGCSYGINAALQRFDTTMDELYAHYCAPGVEELDREELLDRDRALTARGRRNGTRFMGLDVSEPALTYAREAGFVDETLNADFENSDPTPSERDRLARADLVVSTGCLGYVSERTLARVAAAREENRPWMAHFVLRMFPFTPMAEDLAELGYETAEVDGMFRQRMFASAAEQAQVTDTLARAGVDTSGLEDEGWLYARLFVCTPEGVDDPDLASAMSAVSSTPSTLSADQAEEAREQSRRQLRERH